MFSLCSVLLVLLFDHVILYLYTGGHAFRKAEENMVLHPAKRLVVYFDLRNRYEIVQVWVDELSVEYSFGIFRRNGPHAVILDVIRSPVIKAHCISC